MSISYDAGTYLSSMCRRCMLSLLFLVCTFQSCEATKGHKKKGVSTVMTVAAIRSANPNDTFIRVTFSQSQRFYKLPNDADPAYLSLLKVSEKNNTPVVIKRASEESDVILKVTKTR